MSVARSDLFLRACAREPVERLPVWIMRQAGRYLPEYRAVRERHDFLEICRTPELAALVSAQPIERFGFDAAIIFSDILIPALEMGAPIDFRPGPVIGERFDTSQAIERLRVVAGDEELGYVAEAIRLLAGRLSGSVPIIGFAGAPFTVAAYLIEGGSPHAFERVKTFLLREPHAAHRLLDKLARVTVSYLDAQRRAGAGALMLFDSHAAMLSPEDYETFSASYVEKILAALGPGAPRIYFAPGASARLGRMARFDVEVVGVDFRVGIADARRMAGERVALQGNLDPAVLLASRETVAARTRSLVAEIGGRAGHVVNLGHGILPATPIENVEEFLRCVREGAPAVAR